jgi:neutral ceramidase
VRFAILDLSSLNCQAGGLGLLNRISFFVLLFAFQVSSAKFLVGASRVKMTGPALGPLLMGYANPSQKAQGLHMDLFSRAIVVVDLKTHERVALVNLDLSQVSEALRRAVLQRLREIYGDRYHDHNLLLSATHTHSSIGGLSHYRLYTIASLGFEPDNFSIVTDRIVESIRRAENALEPAKLEYVEDHLAGIVKNRSIKPFLTNPEAGLFADGINDQVQQINFRRADGSLIAFWNLFAIHGTSLPNHDHYVSGDNKGWAGWITERDKKFVAAFANGAAGDISPHPLGRKDREEVYQSTRMVAEAQSKNSLDLSMTPGFELNSLNSALQWVEVPGLPVDYRDEHAELCEPAIGYSMIAGAEDGPGSLPGMIEGITTVNLSEMGMIPNIAIGLLKRIFGLSVRDHSSCHGLKPVAFNTWSEKTPGSPRVIPLQIIQFGSVVLAAVPFEATTMSGYRIQQSILTAGRSQGVDRVMMVGYANAYAGYLATPEEYDLQNYEGASTHFGRLTLAGLTAGFSKLVADMSDLGSGTLGAPPPMTVTPSWNNGSRSSIDERPPGSYFGSVEINVKKHYKPADWVTLTFASPNPNNYLEEDRKIFQIEKRVGAHWESRFSEESPETWIRWNQIISSPRQYCGSCIEAKILWRIPELIESGIYRIKFYGKYQWARGRLESFEGKSHEFFVDPK